MKKKHGKILRLKEGYNPNSSSVGSEIPLFLQLTAASGIAAMIVMNTLDSLKKRRKSGEELEQHPPEEETKPDDDAND